MGLLESVLGLPGPLDVTPVVAWGRLRVVLPMSSARALGRVVRVRMRPRSTGGTAGGVANHAACPVTGCRPSPTEPLAFKARRPDRIKRPALALVSAPRAGR